MSGNARKALIAHVTAQPLTRGDGSTKIAPNTDDGFVFGTHGSMNHESGDFDPNVSFDTKTGEFHSFCYICDEIIPNSDITS